MTTRVLVTGAAGFIGGHLCKFLKGLGCWVRAVDWKPPQHGAVACDEHDWQCDIRFYRSAHAAMDGIDHVWALAADMGGMGFIMNYHYTILVNSLLVALNTAQAAKLCHVKRLFFPSSACVYPESLQMSTDARYLTEADAWQGMPESAYGVEKLVAEEIYSRLAHETEVVVRIARFYNIFGPHGTWTGERAKAPASMCRKAAEAKRDGHNKIEVWGDGLATRSFCYISDCLEMMYRLMHSGYERPMNIGTDRLVDINYLATLAAECAGFEPELVHVKGPQGVRGRNADLSLMRNVLGYEPQVSLEVGIQRTYDWVEEQL